MWMGKCTRPVQSLNQAKAWRGVCGGKYLLNRHQRARAQVMLCEQLGCEGMPSKTLMPLVPGGESRWGKSLSVSSIPRTQMRMQGQRAGLRSVVTRPASLTLTTWQESSALAEAIGPPDPGKDVRVARRFPVHRATLPAMRVPQPMESRPRRMAAGREQAIVTLRALVVEQTRQQQVGRVRPPVGCLRPLMGRLR